MSVVKDMKDYLVAEGITLDVFKSQKPKDNPDTCIVLYQYSGSPPSIGQKLQNPSIQVLSRARDYETAMTNIDSIAAEFNKIGDQINAEFDNDGNVTNGIYPEGIELNSTLYQKMEAAQSPFQTGLDENDRHEIKQNFDIIRSV